MWATLDARKRGRTKLVTAAVGAVLVIALPAADTASATTLTFDSLGSEQTFVVPVGVSTLHVVAIGGRGGTSSRGRPGGSGGTATADLPVVQ